MDADQTRETLEMYRQRGIGDRGQAGSRPALLIVDMTNGFTNPESPLGSDVTEQIGHLRKLLGEFRDKGLPVFFTTNLYAPDDPGGRMFLAKVPAIDSLRPGTREVEVDDRIKPLPGETVVEKTVPSGFFGTALAEKMLALGVDTVVVTGCSTSGCIRASANDSMSHGFHTIVVREAVGDRAAGPHEANLFDIDAKLGDVISIGEAIAYLDSLPPQQATPPQVAT